MLSIKAHILIVAVVMVTSIGGFVTFIKMQPQQDVCPKADYIEECDNDKSWEEYKQSKFY